MALSINRGTNQPRMIKLSIWKLPVTWEYTMAMDKTVCFVALDVHIWWLLIPSAACQLVVLVCALFVAVAEK